MLDRLKTGVLVSIEAHAYTSSRTVRNGSSEHSNTGSEHRENNKRGAKHDDFRTQNTLRDS